jgi:hypothetical protein
METNFMDMYQLSYYIYKYVHYMIGVCMAKYLR